MLFFVVFFILVRNNRKKGKNMNKQSYVEKMESKRNALLAAGLVSERYPEVSSIVLHMTYFQRASDSILMKRTVNFVCNNYAAFHMECTREDCTNGGFNLAPVVSALVKNRKKTMKGKLVCNGKNDALSPGHARIAYEVSIQYKKRSK